MKLADVEGMPLDEIEEQVQQGARFVVYEYCMSFIILSLRRSSGIHYFRPGDGGLSPGIRYTLISLLVGWWGIPWGPIWTIRSLVVNVRGGRDVTREMVGHLRGEVPIAQTERANTCPHCDHLAAVVVPLVAQIDALRQTVERQAGQLVSQAETIGRQAAELDAARAQISTLTAFTEAQSAETTPAELPSARWRVWEPRLLALVTLAIAVALLVWLW